jgi:hypothetical protein
MATFDLNTPEVWYPIPDLPGYEVSSHFQVRSYHILGRGPNGEYGGLTDEPRPLALIPVKSGYLTFHIRLAGRAKTIYLHHVVAELAHGPRPPRMMVLHKDDDKKNNFPENLYYGTNPQNWRDSVKNGKATLGAKRKDAKLTDDDIRSIRAAYSGGEGQSSLADRFGVGQGLISRIVNRRRWDHVL